MTKKINLYTLEFGKRYSFIATVKEFVTDSIRPKNYGVKTPEYWNKERIILSDVKILDGKEFVEFEPSIKMDLGKQFQTTSEYDIISFNARVGIISTYYGDYPEDDRGNFSLELSIFKRGQFKAIETLTGTKKELENYIKDNEDYLENNDITSVITCYEVRRLIRPSQLEIELKA